MALVVGAVMVVNWSTSSEPLARQFRTFVDEAVTSNAETAIQIYTNEGSEGLEEYFDRLEQRRRVNAIGFYGVDGNLIAGTDIKRARKLLEIATSSGVTEFERFPEMTYAAKRVDSRSGEQFVYVVEIKRFQAPPFFTSRLLLQALAVILIGGLVCYALALYLTSPIEKLRGAVQELADGNFSARVTERIGKRRDEVAALAKDFDEMAQRIETLITSEKRLTQDISHELRSPLARMNVALELARSRSNADTLPLIGRLETESQRLNDLIGQLLTLSKLETGSAAFEKTEIDFTKLVENIVSDADFEASGIERGVELKVADKIKIRGNETLIRSAVENVLRNATRYTPRGTDVEVGLTSDLHTATLEIRDFGEGVPEEELQKLFKPFYRVSVARDRKSGGIGLGLAIAEQAVSNHGGEIFAENKEKGLLVTIKLPVMA